MHPAGRLALLLVVCARAPSVAGEIPGLPSSLPPYLDRGAELVLSNDFFGSGGSMDDFRTQQIILAYRPAPRWSLLFDHSVVTYFEPALSGRTDQISMSFGYDFVREDDASRNARVTLGTGLRKTGELAGERIQNGFHRIIDNSLVMRPYTNTERIDATAWADAEYFAALHESTGDTGLAGWRFGAWGRANSLVTSDAQWDGSAALYAVASRRSLDLWLGLRRDWRAGYDEPVLRETAAAEGDTAVVLGARVGPLVIETVQQLNNDASYGQVRLVSSGERIRDAAARLPAIGIEAGILLPNVQLHVAARTPTSLLTGDDSTWRESAFIALDYGEPQHADSSQVFIRSVQVGLGIEWERPLPVRGDWVSAYASAGAGYRSEKLVGDLALSGQRSASADSAVLLGGAGLRLDTARLGPRWKLRLQVGLSGRLPLDGADLALGATTLTAQETACRRLVEVERHPEHGLHRRLLCRERRRTERKVRAVERQAS